MAVKGKKGAPPEDAPERALVKAEYLDVGPFRLNPQGMVVQGKPSYEEWEALGDRLSLMDRGLSWIIGDWLVYGEQAYGEQASQALDAGRFSASTQHVYAWVASRVDRKIRVPELSFAHHQAVAALESADQRRWLTLAYNDGSPKSVSSLKVAIAAESSDSDVKWLVTAACRDESDAETVAKQLELEGRQCKVTSRAQKAKKGKQSKGKAITARQQRRTPMNAQKR